MINIAIDGHSSCGKSTMARQLAKTLGYVYIDTGAMYRAVTLWAIRQGWTDKPVLDEQDFAHLAEQVDLQFAPDGSMCMNGENVEQEIRSMEVSSKVSQVSALPMVRRQLVSWQQTMGRHGGVVMDGRDIGTTVLPQAQLKVFVTADVQVRAERRYKELAAKGQAVDLAEIAENLRLRDYQDEHRKESPLRRAEDALLLDNGHLTLKQQNQWLLDRYHETLRQCALK